MRYGLDVSQHYPTLGFGDVRLMLNIHKLTNLIKSLTSVILLGTLKKQGLLLLPSYRTKGVHETQGNLFGKKISW